MTPERWAWWFDQGRRFAAQWYAEPDAPPAPEPEQRPYPPDDPVHPPVWARPLRRGERVPR